MYLGHGVEVGGCGADVMGGEEEEEESDGSDGIDVDLLLSEIKNRQNSGRVSDHSTTPLLAMSSPGGSHASFPHSIRSVHALGGAGSTSNNSRSSSMFGGAGFEGHADGYPPFADTGDGSSGGGSCSGSGFGSGLGFTGTGEPQGLWGLGTAFPTRTLTGDALKVVIGEGNTSGAAYGASQPGSYTGTPSSCSGYDSNPWKALVRTNSHGLSWESRSNGSISGGTPYGGTFVNAAGSGGYNGASPGQASPGEEGWRQRRARRHMLASSSLGGRRIGQGGTGEGASVLRPAMASGLMPPLPQVSRSWGAIGAANNIGSFPRHCRNLSARGFTCLGFALGNGRPIGAFPWFAL